MIKKSLRFYLILLFTLLLSFHHHSVKANTLNVENIDSHKIWTITFNNEVILNDLTKQEISVTDSDGNNVSVDLKLANNNNSIKIIPPTEGYKLGEYYTIRVGKNIKSKAKNGLKDDVIYNFNTENNIVEIENLVSTIYQYDNFELPKTVTAKFQDGTIKDISIKWSVDKPNADKIGTVQYTGSVEGYPKDISLNLNIIPKVISVPDINITLYQSDYYSLPKSLVASMSDGTQGIVAVTWNSDSIDLSKTGIFNYEGTIDGYEKKVKFTVLIKSDFTINFMSPSNNQENVTLKFGYLDIVFSKNVVESKELDKFQLIDENGIKIGILKTQPGFTEKNNFLITPKRPLTANTKYTLFIPKGTIKSENGDIYNEDINISFKTAN